MNGVVQIAPAESRIINISRCIRPRVVSDEARDENNTVSDYIAARCLPPHRGTKTADHLCARCRCPFYRCLVLTLCVWRALSSARQCGDVGYRVAEPRLIISMNSCLVVRSCPARPSDTRTICRVLDLVDVMMFEARGSPMAASAPT